MATPAFIAGDWGTSHLRLTLCDANGAELVAAQGPGALAAKGTFAEIFQDLSRGWRQVYGILPAVLSGMVGSSFGWLKAPYAPCPAGSEEIAAGVTRIDAHDVVIVPGLSCQNPYGAPDVLRGEETQVLGVLLAEPGLKEGRHLLCLPGTHTKWVVLEDGVARNFLTAPTGELYDLLRRHSLLVQSDAVESATPAFAQAVRHSLRQAGADVLHLLFECRSRQLLGHLSPTDASSFLSGLLIARDIAGALSVYGHLLRSGAPLVLVGAPALLRLYATALRMIEVEVLKIDGGTAARLGAAKLFSQMSHAGVIRAS